MKTIASYLRPKALQMSVELTIKLLGTVVELLLPWMLSVILDVYVPIGNIRLILLWGFLMIICAGTALVANVAANRMSTRISRDITARIRYDLFAKITTLSAKQEDDFTTASLISRLTSDTYNLHQLLDRMQRLGVRAPILLVGGMIVTFVLEPVLTLVLITTLPLLALLVILVSRKGVTLYTATQQKADEMVRHGKESMTGVRVIRALSKTAYEMERFDEINEEVASREKSANLLMNITNPIVNLLLNIGLTLVIIVGAYRVNMGVTQTGTIIAFLSYFTMILNALMMVSRLFVMYSKGVASGRRIAEVLEAPGDMQMIYDAPNVMDNEAYIRFEQVSFSYDKVSDNLTDISFSLRRGETLGIIGATGSGKSTILQLLLRSYDPDRGRIYIGGQDIRSIPKKQLYSMFGVVFQNDFLFADTISSNIDFGRRLQKEALEQAVSIAQAEFVAKREKGMEAELAGKGVNLSGGQKQRVMIARAVAAKPDILLLDDSSSALDYKTDAALRQAVRQSLQETTKIFVAQRVNTIIDADKILVLEDGCSIGYGTHQELMKDCPAYHEIAGFQLEEVE